MIPLQKTFHREARRERKESVKVFLSELRVLCG